MMSLTTPAHDLGPATSLREVGRGGPRSWTVARPGRRPRWAEVGRGRNEFTRKVTERNKEHPTTTQQTGVLARYSYPEVIDASDPGLQRSDGDFTFHVGGRGRTLTVSDFEARELAEAILAKRHDGTDAQEAS